MVVTCIYRFSDDGEAFPATSDTQGAALDVVDGDGRAGAGVGELHHVTDGRPAVLAHPIVAASLRRGLRLHSRGSLIGIVVPVRAHDPLEAVIVSQVIPIKIIIKYSYSIK
jgi:hypothetical protein